MGVDIKPKEVKPFMRTLIDDIKKGDVEWMLLPFNFIVWFVFTLYFLHQPNTTLRIILSLGFSIVCFALHFAIVYFVWLLDGKTKEHAILYTFGYNIGILVVFAVIGYINNIGFFGFVYDVFSGSLFMLAFYIIKSLLKR